MINEFLQNIENNRLRDHIKANKITILLHGSAYVITGNNINKQIKNQIKKFMNSKGYKPLMLF